MSPRLIVWFLRALLVLAAAIFVLFYIDINIINDHLSIEFFIAFLVAQPLILISFVCFGERLRIFIPERKLPIAGAFNAFVLATGLNLIVPGRLSEFAKPIYLVTAWRVPASVSLPAMVAERSFDILLVGSLALVALPTNYRSGNIIFVIAVLGIAAGLMPWIAAAVISVLPVSSSRIYQYLRNLIESLAGMREIKRYIYALLLTFLGWMASAISVHVAIGIAASHPTTLLQSMQIFVLTLIGGMVAVLPAGIGTFQAAAMVGLVAAGFSTEESLVLAIFLQIQAMALASIYAGIMLVTSRFDLSSLRARRID